MFKQLMTLIIAATIFVGGPAMAHSMLHGSTPKDGASVSSLDEISLTFSQPVKLATFRLSTDGQQIPVDVDRSAPAAATISVPVPKLAPGHYVVNWGSLSDDGHSMTGSFSFNVSPN